jgi:hypothetical protein
MFSEIDYLVQEEKLKGLRAEAAENRRVKEALRASKTTRAAQAPPRRLGIIRIIFGVAGHGLAGAGQRLVRAGAWLEDRSGRPVLAVEEGNS